MTCQWANGDGCLADLDGDIPDALTAITGGYEEWIGGGG